MSHRKKYSLITSGGQGCIFKPAIPCHKKNSKTQKRRPKRNKQISKLTFHRSSADREYEMNEIVRSIPNNHQWCLLWDTLCETPPFKQLLPVSDITKCLSKKNIKHTNKSRYPLLVGQYGGDTFYSYAENLFSKSAFQNQRTFDTNLAKLIQPIKNLSISLISLNKAGICHGDISVRNVLVKYNKGYLIDFGLSFLFSDKSYIKKRTKFLFSLDKSYDAYPYDFIFAGGTPTQLSNEIKDLRMKDFREGHEDHRRFHEIILGRKDFTKSLINQLKQPKKNLSTIVRSLDTYSVGMLVPTCLHDVADQRNISFETLHERCQNTTEKNKRFLELFGKMTELSSSNRPSPQQVYDMFHT
jgi:hypothetical protein